MRFSHFLSQEEKLNNDAAILTLDLYSAPQNIYEQTTQIRSCKENKFFCVLKNFLHAT